MKIIRYQMITLVGAMLFAVTAHAEADAHARNLAASCAACHGTNGHSIGGAPVLAGLSKAYFVNQMKDFKSGARPSTVMHHHAKGYSDEEFGKLADFFAEQKR